MSAVAWLQDESESDYLSLQRVTIFQQFYTLSHMSCDFPFVTSHSQHFQMYHHYYHYSIQTGKWKDSRNAGINGTSSQHESIAE